MKWHAYCIQYHGVQQRIQRALGLNYESTHYLISSVQIKVHSYKNYYNDQNYIAKRPQTSIKLVIFSARRVCIARTMPSQDVCPSVCHTPVLSLNSYTYPQSFFTVGQPHHSGSPTPNGMAIFRRGPPERGRRQMQGGMKKSRFSTNISLYIANDARQSHSYYGRRIGKFSNGTGLNDLE